MRFQPARYSSPQSFAIPYGEQRQERRVLGRRAGALAVDRAAGRGEDDLRPRARAAWSTFTVPTTFTAAS